MAPVRSLPGGRFPTALRGLLALLCLVPQSGLAVAAAAPAYAPQGLPERQRAAVACTPKFAGATNCVRYTYSGGDQTFTVPPGVTSVYARVFGGGGAGSPSAYYTGQYGGGGGGYTTGSIAVTPGQKLTVTAGQGGLLNSTATTYGGGGAGGLGGYQNLGTGGSGGGLSAVWNGGYGTNPLLVAGGGGGSSPGGDTFTPAGGSGGGSNGGQDNQPTISGRGGSQTAGGAAATQTACAAAQAGSQYLGGRGASASTYEGGGGGGGGYYGGGGGACQRSGGSEANGMGGGGSGYNRGAGVTNTQTSNGTNASGNGVGGTSGGRTDAQYSSGIGNGGGYTNGGNGEVVLEWQTLVGLSIAKTASPTTYVPGRTLTYTVVVSNSGPAPAVGAAVRDALPSALSGFTWTCAAGPNSGCGDASGTGSIDTTATVGVNDRVTYTITGTVPSGTTGTLSNTATVTRPAASTDPNCGPTCSSTVDTPGQVTTGLSVTKTPDRNPYVPGQPLTYTITVKNDGPSDATGVSVRDTLPAAIQNFTWTCTAASGSSCGSTASGTGNINTTVNLPAGGQVTYRLTGTVPPDATGSLDNRATVTPPAGVTDPNCSPNCTSTANPIPPGNQANLVVSKTLLTSPVVPGQPIKWQVKVTNNGPSTARNVVVTDQVPAGVTGATMANDQDSAACPVSNGTATCPAVTIPVNGTASWTLTGTLSPDATTTPTNSAVVTGGPDPSASSRTAVASPTATPTPQAGLTISKTLLTNPVVPGAQIQWRVTVTNNGPSRARNVVVTDQVPVGVTNASMAAADGTACPIANGTATCPAVEIPAGTSTSWTLSGTLSPDATTTPTNTAVVTGGPDPSATARTAVASPSNSPSPQANLTVSKSLLTNPVVPGQPIQWRVTVTNNGPSRARNVVVTDTVPTGVTGATMKADADGTACPISNGTATCPAVEIPAGTSTSWTLNGTLSPDATTTPTNTVTVTGGPDPSASTRTAVASPTSSPSPQANLTVSKSLLTNPVVPGQQIQWQVTVFNSGPSRARNVVVTDTVPAGVTNATMTARDGTACPISNGTATCPAVEIPAGQTASWTLTGTLASDATVTPTNTVTVTGGPDPTASTHTAVASPSNSPSPQANLSVSKVLLTNPVVPGQQIQWRVSVTNNGPSRARNVVVTDQVPAGVTNASMVASDGTACPIANGTATCPAVEIPAGQTLTWTLTGTLASDATVTPTNTVTVTGGPDPTASTHTAVASPSNSPSPQANLSVSKVLVTNPVVPGQQIQWRVSVTNNGPSRARNVVVTDQVPAGVNDASMAASDGTACPISNGVATCPAVEIPAGSSASWTLTGTLASDATVTPTNTVTVTGGPDPATPTHTAVASPSNSPSPQANLSVSKVLVTNPVVPGQQIQWQVSVTNNGPSRARNVVVTDQVPAGVTNASMTASDGTACPISNGTATCPAVEIPAGQTLTWTLTGTLDPNATTTPTNGVTVTGGPDPTASSHTAVASPTGTPTPQAGLSIAKTLLTNPVVPGQQIQWQVSVTNNGPSRARNVVVTDQVPAGVTNASMAASDGTACPIANGTATCPAVEIPVGDTLTWTLTGTLAPDATTTPTNTAVVTGGPDPSATARTAVASPSSSPSPQASLTVSKVLLTDPVIPGRQIQWRVTVSNGGPSLARNVVVTDTVPAGVNDPSMAAADGTACPISNGTATCPAVEIPAGSSASWTLTGTLASDATVTPTNTVTVTGGPDPATPTHTAVASPSNSPSPQANLSVSKVLVTNPVVPGQQVQWQVSVTNNGPSVARNVAVTDQVPAGVNDASMRADADGAACPIISGTASCPAVEIPVGQTVTWTLTGTLASDATATPTNTATVTGGPDPTTPTHTAVASPSNSPSPQANLSVSKVLVTNPVVPGQQIQWQVSVTNNGPSRARNVVVSDQVPAGVGNATMTGSDGSSCPIANGTATCPAVEIPVGQTMTWTLSGTLASDATATPTNTATVTGGPDPATPTHTAVASPSNSPSPQARLTVAKVLVTNPVVPGQQIQWQVSVTNNGPSVARNVVVSDQVPSGVTNASMVAQDGTACPIANGTATCLAVEIPVGQTVTWTLTGTLASDATATPTNTATVTGGPDPTASTHAAVASPSNSPSPQANLTVAKVLVTNPVVPGQQVQWQVSVTNNGPSVARNVVVSDQVPSGVTNASMVAQDGTACPIANGTATCPAVEIPVGQTVTWTLTGTLASDATATPVNTATVTGGPDPATPTHTAVASPSNSPSPQASLTVVKVLVTNPVVPGQQVQWQVSVTNNGPSVARNVVVSDQVPAGVSNASMAGSDGSVCPIVSGTATCPAVEIPVGQTMTWTLTGTLAPDATATPTNTATVTGGPDPTASTHTAVASPSNSPSPQANLTVSKVLVTNPVVPGRQIQWRVSVTNNGPSRARNVVVTDQIPAGVSGASMTSDTDNTPCPIASGTATCPAVGIPVGQTVTWTLTGTLASDATATPTNTVTVTGGPDPATPTHTAVASPSNSPSPQANLTVAKVLVTNPVVPGQQIQWQVSVTNNGPSVARNVVVSDQVPAGVTNASMAAQDGTACPIANGTATCPAVEIPVGQTVTWTLTGTLASDATATPTNTATVTGGPDPATPTHTAVASPSNSPSPQANLTVAKVLVTNPVVPGQQIQWQVSVTNNGPSVARNVVVSDQVPAGVTNASMAAQDGTACPIANGTATCPAVEIPVGQTVTWTLTGTLASDATATPTNTATVTGGPDPATPTHTAVASPSNSPSVQANLSVSKVLLTDPVIPGQRIQWRVAVTNNGPSRARNVIVTDRVPDGVGGASMTAADGTVCPVADGTAVCPAIELAVGQTAAYTLTGTLMQDATVTPTNTATVTGGPDPATPTHTAVASPSNSPSPQASLTVSKVLLTDPVVPGERIQWRVAVTNNGPSRARNVVVTDRIPDGVDNAVLQADADATRCPVTNGTAVCPAIELEVGQTASYTLTGTLAPDATTTPTNTAVVTRGPDPSATAHTAVASPSNSPSPQANLTIAKVLLTNPVVPGERIQWRVTVTNNGPSRARNVVVTDTVPAMVDGPSMSADADGTACPISNGTATCPAVEIPAGATVSYTVTGTLDQAATSTPVNVAVVTGGPDPTATAHTATAQASETVVPQARLTVSKALVTDPVVPGQPIAWRISVTNNGPSRARNVVVSDRLPDGVVGASLSPDATRAACPVSDGVATCPPVEIAVGDTVTYTLSGTLAQDATTVPGNTALVTGGPDPSTSTHTAVASPSNSPSPQANLTVAKVLVTDPVVPGEQIAWRVTVLNNGPSRARNVVVTDRIPSGVSGAMMTSDENGAACPIGSGVATCPAIELEVGQLASYTLSGTLDANATVTPTNAATVTGGPDPATPTHTAVASPSNSPSPQANLTVSKALLTNPVVPGQQIQWQISVTNNGPSLARNVVVTDQVPSGVTNAAMVAQDGTPCPIANGTATCPAVEIAPGTTLTWTLTGTLASDATVTPTNTVTVTGGPDPATPTHTAVASPSNSPSPQANLTVAKVLVTNPVVPGEQIQWQVSVTNNGPSRARNVVVSDQVPSGVTSASMAAQDGTPCPIADGTATCPAVEIPAGATFTWTLTGTLDPGATVTPTNAVTVTGGPDPATPTHTAVASPSGSPSPQANLSVSKVLVTNPVVPGEQIQWRVSVTNNGPSRARNVVVSDQVPSGVTSASMAAQDGTPCPIADGTATCPAVEIPAGATFTWTLTGTLDPGATVTPTNTVTVTGGPDPATPTHTAVASPSGSPSPQARLTVSKVLLTDPVVPGRQIQWQVAVTNQGPATARDVVVTDQVPAGVAGASMAADDGTACPIAGGTATCPAVDIPVGSTRTWTLTGTLDPGATVTPTNAATVTGGPDPATPTHTAVASPSNSPSPQASLTVAKALVTDPVVAGAPIEWRVTVTNNGPSVARGVVVTDRVPAGVTGASMTAQDGTACPITDGTATCPAVGIPVGGTLTWTLTGTLDPGATVTPANTATVTGGPDPATPTHTAVASPSGSPSARARLTVAKVLLTSPVVAGQRIQWRVTVTNDGPSLARNVVVTDQVPAGVNGASMTADADGTPCPIADGVATCPAVDVPVGTAAAWTLSGTLDPDATVTPTNTATVTGGPDPVTPTHTAVATPTEPITVQHDLLLTKQAAPANPKAGDTVTYTVTATNRASGTYLGAVITDDLTGVLDGAVYGGNAHAGTGRTAYAAPKLTWTLDIRPGATETLSYTVTVKADAGGRTLVNRLTADGSNCGADTAARRAAEGGNCSTSTEVQSTPSPSPSPSPSPKPPLPPTGSGGSQPALLVTLLLLVLGGILIAARRSRR
ncbi:hypothetical protein AB0O91_05900 [Kitasatospora sp. NPDC089797]|uniref:DUF7927 domain-containing protein n=1 Tax=Kitasatospora sp. NPDC089797 TaxID=3155298 RepID=UPI00342CC8A5